MATQTSIGSRIKNFLTLVVLVSATVVTYNVLSDDDSRRHGLTIEVSWGPIGTSTNINYTLGEAHDAINSRKGFFRVSTEDVYPGMIAEVRAITSPEVAGVDCAVYDDNRRVKFQSKDDGCYVIYVVGQ